MKNAIDNCTFNAEGPPLFAELEIDKAIDMFTLVGVLQCKWPSLMMISFKRDNAPHSLWLKRVHYGAIAVIPHSADFEAFIANQGE